MPVPAGVEGREAPGCVSVTPFADLKNLWGEDKVALKRRNILFQEDRNTYIRDMLNIIGVRGIYI